MEDQQDLIERFFDKKLNEKELQDFQRKLQDDDAFAQAFEMEKDLLEGIESLGNDRLRLELQQIHREERGHIPDPPPIKKINSRRSWWIAAAIVFGLLLTWWLWPKTATTPTKLYAQYAQHDFSFLEKNNTIDTEKQLLFSAERNLIAGNYPVALIALNQYLALHPEDQEILLAKGIALLEIGTDYPAARAIFQKLTNSNSLLSSDGQWYLALTELQQGDLEACRKVLQQIPQNSVRYPKAKELIERLDSF